ncbi:hypothetical protein HJC23_012491 [Cyclotella cryptica]|uniref:Histone deacetylase domain-containing protein n=1 Tax=Cyclotella cryptica TaxID=29204 RepID=A0ABD3PA35_9STRA
MVSTIFPEEELDVKFDSHHVVSKTRKRSRLAQAVKVDPTSSLSTEKLLDSLNPSLLKSMSEHEADSISPIKPLLPTSNNSLKKSSIQVALLHSHAHTQILYRAMHYIHRDRDLLLQSLLKWCGFFHGATKGPLSSFLTIVPPQLATRQLLEDYHESDYLDLLQFPSRSNNVSHDNESDDGREQCNDRTCDDATMKTDGSCQRDDNDNGDSKEFRKQLSTYGLEDDCPMPADAWSRALLWKYCLAVAGGSCLAASLLVNEASSANRGSQYVADVSIHWGGGRHHAHSNKAGGFCYVNDVVLAIRKMLDGVSSTMPSKNDSIAVRSNYRKVPRILYIDLDIHHPDGVQSAFYSTDQVLTASFHRHSAGFFPASFGSITEKGQLGSKGLGYNLNIPLPAGIGNISFLHMYRKLLFGLVNVYDPQAIVLCVGADGLKGDPLVEGRSHDFNSVNFSPGENDADDVPYYVRNDCFDVVSSSTVEGWALSPECLAECVRITAALSAGWEEDMIFIVPSEGKDEKLSDSESTRISMESPECQKDVMDNTPIKQENVPTKISPQDHTRMEGKKRKLLVLGGGGYSPSQASRTWLLCTAAACEGARPGLFWSHLPKDIPHHIYFPRYGPTFELVSEETRREISAYYSSSKEAQVAKMNDGLSDSDQNMLHQGIKAIDLACLYIERQRTKSEFASMSSSLKSTNFCYDSALQHDREHWEEGIPKKNANKGYLCGRRKKKKKAPSVL